MRTFYAMPYIFVNCQMKTSLLFGSINIGCWFFSVSRTKKDSSLKRWSINIYLLCPILDIIEKMFLGRVARNSDNQMHHFFLFSPTGESTKSINNTLFLGERQNSKWSSRGFNARASCSLSSLVYRQKRDTEEREKDWRGLSSNGSGTSSAQRGVAFSSFDSSSISCSALPLFLREEENKTKKEISDGFVGETLRFTHKRAQIERNGKDGK